MVLEMINLGLDVAHSVGYLPGMHKVLGTIPAPNKTIITGAASLQSLQERGRQEDQKVRVIFSYIVMLRAACGTQDSL